MELLLFRIIFFYRHFFFYLHLKHLTNDLSSFICRNLYWSKITNAENFHRAKSIENKRLILAVLWHARREKFKMYRHFRQKNLFLSILFFYLIEPFSVTGDALFEFRIFIMLIFYPWNFIQFVKGCYASSFPNKAIQREVMNIRNSSITLEKTPFNSFLLWLFFT